MTISGISRVVADGPRELRVVVPAGERSRRALPPAVRDGPNIRLKLTNAASGDVKWHIQVKPGPVQPAAPIAGEDKGHPWGQNALTVFNHSSAMIPWPAYVGWTPSQLQCSGGAFLQAASRASW